MRLTAAKLKASAIASTPIGLDNPEEEYDGGVAESHVKLVAKFKSGLKMYANGSDDDHDIVPPTPLKSSAPLQGIHHVPGLPPTTMETAGNLRPKSNGRPSYNGVAGRVRDLHVVQLEQRVQVLEDGQEALKGTVEGLKDIVHTLLKVDNERETTEKPATQSGIKSTRPAESNSCGRPSKLRKIDHPAKETTFAASQGLETAETSDGKISITTQILYGKAKDILYTRTALLNPDDCKKPIDFLSEADKAVPVTDCLENLEFEPEQAPLPVNFSDLLIRVYNTAFFLLDHDGKMEGLVLDPNDDFQKNLYGRWFRGFVENNAATRAQAIFKIHVDPREPDKASRG